MKQSVSNLSGKYKINFDYSLNSGQVFLWEKIDTKWYGVDGTRILILENSQKFKKNMKYENDFFRLDDNFEKISNDLKNDNHVRNALKMFPGLRLIRQNPFQCYISFIVS